MSMAINTNVASLNSQRNLASSQGALQTSLQRLSSGLRINSAKDDAAGLAISERMSSQIRGLDQAKRNANDGISLAQTAEGALGEIGNNLQRIRELAVQAANATNSASDKAAIQSEVDQLASEITRVGNQTQFNGTNLLDGTFTAKSFQVGANAGQTIDIAKIGDARATALGSHTLKGATPTVAGTVVAGIGANGMNASAAGFAITTAGGGKSGTISYAADADAKVIAAKINEGAASVGVMAKATNEATLGSLSAAGNISFTLNGQAVSANVTNNADLTELAAAINSVSGNSGVTAKLVDGNKGSLKLTSADGSDIKLGAFASDAGTTESINFSGTTLTEGTAVAATKVGTVELTSSKGQITLTNGDADAFGTTVKSTISTVAGINLTTAQGAQDALDVLDAALATVNSSRADLGAYQNRFSSAISNLQSSSENLNASRGRILDADFASETAKMSRNQVLQQAGTAMLAQANQLPQQVLQLLR
ncbi:flagellin N-terminal helical domain-containing protein [Crenobacter intestini]|uniref:Flagellin n=1 Tax=Crenobacter intestini TaxID=2563443 RepID=A0A4T0UZT2_9NEIS|nr:flagellin [Crenobacter intestini]TIC84744.1 flagellin [Crenobacter intestini]